LNAVSYLIIDFEKDLYYFRIATIISN